MKKYLTILLFMICIQLVHAQSNAPEVIKPILLDKSALSGVGLRKVNLKDEPEKIVHQKRLYKGEDISIYIVSTETWNNQFTNFSFDEFVYMFHGEAIVKPQNGQTQLFYSGDYFFAPKGYTGEWEIKAGENLHYELSVITTRRADSSLVSNELTHQLFNRSTLSGAHISLGEDTNYTETLRKGVELTIKLQAEKPTESHEPVASGDKLIQLLSGQVTITDLREISQTFYSGDFFILPKGFEGIWKSEGLGLVKYLTIEKTTDF